MHIDGTWQVWIRQPDNSWSLLQSFRKQEDARDFHKGVERNGFRAAIRFLSGLN